MLIGKGYTDQFLSDAEVHELAASALSQAGLDGKRVIVIIPDGTRTAPIPQMFRLFHELLGEKAAVFPSKGEARKMIQGNGVSINKEKINIERKITTADLLHGRYLLVQKGKKNYYLIVAE